LDEIFIADAHRDGQRFIVRADETLTAFLKIGPVLPRHGASHARVFLSRYSSSEGERESHPNYNRLAMFARRGEPPILHGMHCCLCK